MHKDEKDNRIFAYPFGPCFRIPGSVPCSGLLMGKNELTDLLLPVLKTGSTGYASWKLFPEYPTLRSYVEVLLDSPEFFVMFWNSVKITLGALAGELLVGMPAAWGFARFDFPGKKGLFTLYIALMMMPFQVMLLGNYLVLDDLRLWTRFWELFSRRFSQHSPVFIMYRFLRESLWRFWKRQDLTAQVNFGCFL